MIQESILRKLATNGTVFRKGNDYFRKGYVKGIKTLKHQGEIALTAYVQDELTNKVEMRLTTSADKLVTFKCTCAQSKAYPGVCKHGIATLIEYSARREPLASVESPISQDAHHSKNLVLESLLCQYKNVGQSVHKVVLQEEHPSLKLVPNFSFSQDGIVSMALSIGADKLYPVENIYQLSQDIQDNRLRAYGRSNMFRHGLSSFQISSRELVKRVSHLKPSEQGLQEGSESASLTSSEVRKIFKVCKGETWPCYHPLHKEVQAITWQAEPFDIQFVVEENEEQFTISIKNKEVKKIVTFYEGDYILYEDSFYAVDESFKARVWPLMQAIMKEESHTLSFGPEDMRKVSRLILPSIHQQVEMNLSEESLEAYIPPELEMKIYLDLPKKSSLTAKVMYQYGEEVFNPANEEQAPSQIRDEYKEYAIENALWEYGFNKGTDGTYLLDKEAMVYNFIREAIEPIMKWAQVYISDNLKQARVRQVKSVSLGIRLEGDWLGIDLSCIGIPREELGRILDAYRARKKYFRLKNGEFVDLTGEGLEQLDSVVEGLNLTEQEIAREELLIPKYRALYLDKLLKEEKHIKPTRDSGFKSLIQDFEEIEDVAFSVPAALQGILREYQVTGYKWMKTLGNYGFGGILADDMGLGKSLQMIAVLSSEASEKASLIVCPTSLVFNWENEFQKFAPHMKILLVQGSQSQREEKIKVLIDYDVVVTSYDSLKRDSEKYNDYTFNYCIIDEAQYIKNSQTQNAKAVKEIKSQKRMALTGTPIENSLSELWSIFDFIMPGYLLGESQFRKKIEMPIIKDQDEEVMKRLKKMIAPFIIRRLKKEVIEELPDKTESVVYSELSEEQYKVYVAYVAKAREELMEQIEAEGIEKSHIKMLACLTRLRQICCHPSLFLENYTGESAKLETCLELVRNTTESGHKILLFSQFTSMLAVIAEGLKAEGISYSLLKGDVKAEKRRELVETFNTGDTQVFLISLKAGGVGLNLTSADVVIHYDPWWNASAENQATDRAYRIGQMNNVQVFKLITRGTIEEKIKAMQDQKQDLTENILSTEQTFINRLSKEAILDLFAIE